MKSFLRALSLVSGTALLFAAVPFAHADPLTITSFTVYEGFDSYNDFAVGHSNAGDVPTTSNPGSTGLAYGVFSPTTLSSITSLNYSSTATGYTVDTFYGVSSAGYSSTGNGTVTMWSATASLEDTGVFITGTLYLPAGTDTLTTMSDDGIILTINNTVVISDPATQNETADSGMYTAATSGLYNFTIQYDENADAPADLIFSDPYTSDGGPPPPSGSTPEPSSLLLLGTGVLGAAGLVRRRMAVTAKPASEGIR